MPETHRMLRTIICATLLLIAPLSTAFAQAQAPPAQKETMTKHATGPFEVKITPQPTDDKSETPLGRMSIDKQLHGDLEGTSHGEMLTAGTTEKNSGGYVAVERFTGTLHGRTGTFILQHSATMNRGVPHLLITVVPDSGTGQLKGIAGTFNVIITKDGKHSYDFEYTLPETQ